MTSEKFYITTAIDYPNSAPHLGHAYEKTLADFYHRWYRQMGLETRFVTGLDEHGQKIQEAATKAGVPPQDFVDEKARTFVSLCETLGLTQDDFIRTSQERHHRLARQIWSTIEEKGDIYFDDYEGTYCVPCESYLTETQIKAGMCSEYTGPDDLITIKEESYFFRLGKYREWIRDHIRENPEFIYPEQRRNEILARLDDEVRDLSISRSTFDWGIPVPGNEKHVMYVWFDALSNYISALKEPEDLYETFWPADLHVIGKDITWFHAVIWPCMLHSAGLPLPRQIYVHGFILDDQGNKMSKSVGNVVDPLEVCQKYGAEVLRFYLLRAFSSGQDGKFSVEDLEQRYQGELGNDLGNLVLRVTKLVGNKLGGKAAPPSTLLPEADFAATVREFSDLVDRREHHKALEVLWSYIRSINAFLNERAPWKLDSTDEIHSILYGALEALRAVSHLLAPVMPGVTDSILEQIGAERETGEPAPYGSGSFQTTIGKPLFPRLEEPGEKKKGGSASGKGNSEKSPKKNKGGGGGGSDVDPFSRLEIRVAEIEEVEPHPDADALWVLTVRTGSEEGDRRTICAGLRAHLEADELRGRRVIILANLKPARLRGIESRGMVLATDDESGRVVPVDPGSEAGIGELVTVEGVEPSPKSKLSTKHFDRCPLLVKGGRVTYCEKPLKTSAGEIQAPAADGAEVR